MDQLHLHVSDLSFLAPELSLVICAMVLTLLDLVLPKQVSRTLLGWLTLVGIAVSAIFIVMRLGDEPINLLNNSYRIDDFGNLFKLLFLGGTGLIIFMSLGSLNSDEIPHKGELYYLLLPAVLGAMIMTSSGDLITLYVGLELLSITTYILVGMRKKNQQSNEAAFKYIVLGSIASAMILYGMSFIYGMTGSTNMAEIRGILFENYESYQAMIYLSFFLILAGLGFKIAAAPFHQWAPDVYQGAPIPVAAFLAVVSKGAAIALLFRIVYLIYFGVGDPNSMPISDDIFLVLTVLAAAAMIIGNLIALRQRNMKRLLAYSGVANAGYLLVPIAAQLSMFHWNNFSELYYYLIAYFLMNIGAFAVFTAVSKASGNEEMSGYAGLYYRAPWTAVAMIVFILSLSGFPITGGFFGKLFIMFGALNMDLIWLAIIMIITSVLSFYYYFAIIKQMFMRSASTAKDIVVSVPLAITIWICVVLTVLMGLFPQWLLEAINNVFTVVNDLVIIN
ncbi:MAG: NADH-quinone oxidoreductase subunit N [Paenibacillaceae bacterium]